MVVERFVHLVNPKLCYPVAIKAQAPYPVSGIPHAFLVGVDGKIVWDGHPGSLSEDIIKTELRKVRKWRDVEGRRARHAGKALDKGEFGKALSEAKKVLANAHADDADKKSASEIVAHVEAVGKRRLAWADALKNDGNLGRAEKILDEVKKEFERTDFADQAGKALAGIQRDKSSKELLAANDLMAKILDRVKTPAGDREREAALHVIQKRAESADGPTKDFLDHWVDIFKEKWVPKHS